jgi:hypothetical protein
MSFEKIALIVSRVGSRRDLHILALLDPIDVRRP